MNKKNFLAIILGTAIFSLIFTACGQDEQDNRAYELYSQAAAAFRQVDSVLTDSAIMSIIRVIGGDLDGEQLELLSTSNVAQIINSPTDIYMRIELTTSLDGVAIPMVSYFRNGIYYVDIQGEQFSMPIALEDVLVQTNATILEFPQSAIINQLARETASGAELSFTLNGSQLTNLVDTVADGILALFGGTLQNADISPSNIEATISIDESQIPIFTAITLQMTIDYESITFLVDITAFIEILQVGNVEFEFPSELANFPQLDFGL
ncbi:MAG: hypothetical protein FWG68_11260 [Defluviitaleaceae bacterium]|nr:hypothetical protein [Defluviitaleaceae bacterium]